jgi:hypothetical protein
MQIHRVFDDLGEFMAAYRGGISRDAILIDLDERHVPGTVLELDLALADGLSLVKGRAAVVDVRQAPSHALGSWRTVLRFASLQPDSRDFLERLERRQEAEGEPVFRPDLGPNPPAGVSEAELTDTGALEVAFLDLARKPTVRERAVPVEERGPGAGGGSRGRGLSRLAARIVGAVAIAAAAAVAVWIFRPELLGGGPPQQPAPVAHIGTETPAPDPTPVRTPPAAATVPAEAPVPVSTPESAAPGGPRATELAWSVEDADTVVRITADRDLSPAAVQRFRMDNDPGPREVIVIRGARASDLPLRQDVDDSRVAGIRTWLHSDRTPPELHVVLDLTDAGVSADEPVVDGRTVTVRIR